MRLGCDFVSDIAGIARTLESRICRQGNGLLLSLGGGPAQDRNHVAEGHLALVIEVAV